MSSHHATINKKSSKQKLCWSVRELELRKCLVLYLNEPKFYKNLEKYIKVCKLFRIKRKRVFFEAKSLTHAFFA